MIFRLGCFVLLPLFAFSQTYTESGPQNEYASAHNPHYWKNHPPHPSYWQQDVHYRIRARIDETTDIITGHETLVYTNNSPDTLRHVFFHLYQNAFQPGSHLHDLQIHNQVYPTYGRYESKKQGTLIDTISSGGSLLRTEADNTILKVYLPQPLPPGAKVELQLVFRTFYDSGSTRRRMKKYKVWGYNHYNGCQWYPKMCVYDARNGWNTDQHLNREFYGDFGCFDVELTFASNYVVEATGVLQNESEVLPDSLKKKLDICNFKDKKWDSKPDTITPYVKGQTKTWKYHAENVHDFAFTADPTYRIHDTIIYPGRANGGGVRCVAIVQEPHASGWQTAHAYLARIIQVFSRDFGVFEYPKIVVADAADGMEYPMLTLDGGKDPEYKGLLVHEVGHNWFYGMVGSNETYRACMDEGFTQFLTAWGMEALDGDTIAFERIKRWYPRKFYEPINVRDNKAYISYLSDAVRNDDESINTHSDMFNGALGQGGGYRQVYSKTATMLYNLQYVLGDSLFSVAMKKYVAQWKFRHPYPEDFRRSIIHSSGTDLNWFFDEWMETTKKVDYKISGVKFNSDSGGYVVKLKRKGRMQMPIDLRVTLKDGSVLHYYIPNTWFEKKTASITLPRWLGWDKLHPEYHFTIHTSLGVKQVEIDPTQRLADVNMLNNQLRVKAEFRFDSRIYPFASWKKYRLWMRPDLWYNEMDGIKIGVNLYGNYMSVKHNFNFTAWVNTHLAQGIGVKEKVKPYAAAQWFSYQFSYSHLIDNFLRRSTVYFQSRWSDGVEIYKLGMSIGLPKNITLDLHFKSMNRPRLAWNQYLLYPNEWGMDNSGKKMLFGLNNTLNLGMRYNYSLLHETGFVRVALRSSALWSKWDYHYLEVEHIDHTQIWKMDLHTRVYGRLATGKNPAPESQLYFAGANAEEMMENKYTRSAGWVPHNWVGTYGSSINHFHHSGGLNLRGYAGYLVPEYDKQGVLQFAYRGMSGASFSGELDFNRLVRVKNAFLRDYFSLQTYLFTDFGAITYNNSEGKQQFSRFRADAGVGALFTIKKFGPLQGIKPLSVRFDLPFYISHAPLGQKNVDFRFVMGVTRFF